MIGPYKIVKELGEGSFSQVYEGICQNSQEVVAVKVLKKKCESKKEVANLRELRFLSEVKGSPHIIPIKSVQL